MSKQQKLVLIISILASFVAFLDGSIVNVALPAITRELGGGLAIQQWVVDAYLITLGSLMLIAGSLSDIFGRKKILAIGLIGFAVASIICSIAPTNSLLIVGRALQGVAGALLVPSSLALIISTFSGAAQGKAIGSWTAWTGIAFIVGPLAGGYLVDASSWRLIFAINIVPIAVILWLMSRLEQKEATAKRARVDAVGSILCAIALGGSVYALIEHFHKGWSNPLIYLPLLVSFISGILFILYEHRTVQPMLPLSLFKIRNFYVGNIATLAIYGGLSVASFLITVFVQQAGGYSAMQAGLTLLPVTIIMFVLSSKFGALAGRFGPRAFMAIGPIIAGAGFLTMLLVDESVNYWTQLLPGILIFGLGLAVTVAPLTSAILGSIDSKRAGIGSAVNNAVARIAGLVAIAAIGIVTGPDLELQGFHRGVIVMASLLIAGGLISAVGIKNSQQ